MTTRSNTHSTNSFHTKHRHEQNNVRLSQKEVSKMPPVHINTHSIETKLSPKDELECLQIYEKLKRLQPNGVCADLNTLRRALYPPASFSNNKNLEFLSFKTYGHSYDIPSIKTKNVPKLPRVKTNDCLNIDRIVNQVKHHSTINYSYYTRTK